VNDRESTGQLKSALGGVGERSVKPLLYMRGRACIPRARFLDILPSCRQEKELHARE